MNPAKAAPSALSEKKPPGKIRRSSRAACLSYFFFYLRWVRQKTHKGIANNLA